MLAEAEHRCDAFFKAGLDRRYPRYLPSNPEKVFAAIATLKESGLLRGDVFCEWGSGFGIATCMASLLGFKAYGIEIEDGPCEALHRTSSRPLHPRRIPLHQLPS